MEQEKFLKEINQDFKKISGILITIDNLLMKGNQLLNKVNLQNDLNDLKNCFSIRNIIGLITDFISEDIANIYLNLENKLNNNNSIILDNTTLNTITNNIGLFCSRLEKRKEQIKDLTCKLLETQSFLMENFIEEIDKVEPETGKNLRKMVEDLNDLKKKLEED